MNRDIMQVLRAMILEYKLSNRDWPYLIPVVQASLNHTAVPSLAGKVPVELFTGLDPPSPLDAVFLGHEAPEIVTAARSTAAIESALAELRSSVLDMHHAVKDARLKQTLLNKKKERGESVINFTVGDYVLRSRVDEKQQNKLLVTWVGPYVVTEAHEHAFTVKHLVTGMETTVHASRLKFFADKDLDITEELLEHVAAQGIVLRVRKLLQHRWNEQAKTFELLVSWVGLEAIEDSWEPLKALHRDVRSLVQGYSASTNDPELQSGLTALEEVTKRH